MAAQLTRALDAATAITNDYSRAQALTALAPTCPPTSNPVVPLKFGCRV
jgi:hypothetical protein